MKRGIDIFNNILTYLFKDLCNYTEPSKLIEEKVKSNKLGTKTGEGFYNWSKDLIEDKQKERAETLLYFLNKDKNK